MARAQGKKGQEAAAGAATLVIFIAFVIIVFILMLPPQDRDELLGVNQTSGGGTITPRTPSITLLSESPGSLFPNEQRSFDHNLNQVVLSATQEDRVLASRPSVYVMNSKLSSQKEQIGFSVNTGKERPLSLLLSFEVAKGTGRLIVKLNGVQVFNGELVEGWAQPIELRTELLRESNTLEFEVSDVPWYSFFRRNQYELREVKVIASLLKLDAMASTTTFTLSSQEVEEFESGYLRFIVECSGKEENGLLRVYLNRNLLASFTPYCQGQQKLELDREYLYKGRNELSFELTRGSLYLSGMLLRITLRQPKWPVYYFEVNSSLYKKIQDRRLEVPLRIDFVRDSEQKQAELTINGRIVFVDTRADSYTHNLRSYLVEGNNYIRIKPETTLRIANLKVYVKE